jgi:hypothetical protein
MSGFYEEMADFADMSEDAGYLGPCATGIAELFRAESHDQRRKLEVLIGTQPSR